MKRISIFLVIVFIVTSVTGMVVSASDLDNVEELDFFTADGVIAEANDAAAPMDYPDCVCGDMGRDSAPVARTVCDLNDGAVSIDWNLPAEDSLYTTHTFKTNTQKIVVHLTGDIKVSLSVRLYNSDRSLVGTVTKNVSTSFGTDYSFSGLTASETYYVKITNNGQQDVNIVGTLSQ